MCLIKDGYNFSQIYGMLSPVQVYDESEQTTNSEEGSSASSACQGGMGGNLQSQLARPFLEDVQGGAEMAAAYIIWKEEQ